MFCQVMDLGRECGFQDEGRDVMRIELGGTR